MNYNERTIEDDLIRYRQDRDTFSERDKQMLSRVNYKAPEEKRRYCLAHDCGKAFLSRGPYHRLCNSCRSYFGTSQD